MKLIAYLNEHHKIFKQSKKKIFLRDLTNLILFYLLFLIDSVLDNLKTHTTFGMIKHEFQKISEFHRNILKTY